MSRQEPVASDGAAAPAFADGWVDAIVWYREALRLKPDYAAARDTLREAEAGR